MGLTSMYYKESMNIYTKSLRPGVVSIKGTDCEKYTPHSSSLLLTPPHLLITPPHSSSAPLHLLLTPPHILLTPHSFLGPSALDPFVQLNFPCLVPFVLTNTGWSKFV